MENFIIANCTDTGKVRTVNEDSMATFESPNGRIVVVCDGMGGQNAGDVASQLAIAVIQDILTDNTFNSPEEAITRSITAANQAILKRSSQNPELSGMGATCVMLIIRDGKVWYGSVGDSRIYYIAQGMIRQITKDQSYVQTLVDAGELTQEAAEHHKDKNQITNALGLDGMTPPVICQMPITPEPGSVFLLCSDGLSGMVSNKAMADVVSDTTLSLHDRAEKLVALANNAGGVDNITVQLVSFQESGAASAIGHSPRGGKAGGRKQSNNKTAYWVAAIACIIVAIGIITYSFIPSDEPEQVAPGATYTEQPRNSSPKRRVSSGDSHQTTTVVVKETPSAQKTSKKKDAKSYRENILSGNSKTPKNKENKKPEGSTVTPQTKRNEVDLSVEKD